MHCGSVFGDHTHTHVSTPGKNYICLFLLAIWCASAGKCFWLYFMFILFWYRLFHGQSWQKSVKSPGSPQEVPRKSPGSPVSAVTRLLVRNVMFLLTLSGRAVTANLENPESQHRMHVIWGKSGFPHMDVVTRWRILHIITTSVPIWILVFLNSATQTLVSVNSLTDIDAHERQLFTTFIAAWYFTYLCPLLVFDSQKNCGALQL